MHDRMTFTLQALKNDPRQNPNVCTSSQEEAISLVKISECVDMVSARVLCRCTGKWVPILLVAQSVYYRSVTWVARHVLGDEAMTFRVVKESTNWWWIFVDEVLFT